MDQKSIFDKVDLSVVSSEAPSWVREVTPELLAKRKRQRRKFRILDLIGLAAWLYIATKLLIFDVDRFIVESITPGLAGYLKFRLVGFMIILSIMAIIFRRHWTSIVYVSSYPAVLLLWKIPRLIYRTRSWIVFLGAFNLAASFFRDFKFNIVSKTLATIAILVALLSTSSPTTLAALIVLHGILAWVTFRTVKFSLTPSRFLLLQRKFIDHTSEGAIVNQITSIKPELQDEGIEKFDRQQFTTFHTTLSMAVLWHKGIYFWAYQLERYRQSATLHVFGLASYLWLFLQTVFVFSLTNYALLRLNPSAFNFEEKPTYVKIL